MQSHAGPWPLIFGSVTPLKLRSEIFCLKMWQFSETHLVTWTCRVLCSLQSSSALHSLAFVLSNISAPHLFPALVLRLLLNLMAAAELTREFQLLLGQYLGARVMNLSTHCCSGAREHSRPPRNWAQGSAGLDQKWAVGRWDCYRISLSLQLSSSHGLTLPELTQETG